VRIEKLVGSMCNRLSRRVLLTYCEIVNNESQSDFEGFSLLRLAKKYAKLDMGFLGKLSTTGFGC